MQLQRHEALDRAGNVLFLICNVCFYWRNEARAMVLFLGIWDWLKSLCIVIGTLDYKIYYIYIGHRITELLEEGSNTIKYDLLIKKYYLFAGSKELR